MSDSSEMLARIDERTEQILASLQELKSRSDRLDKAVFIGNGQPALLERVSTLETQFAQFMVSGSFRYCCWTLRYPSCCPSRQSIWPPALSRTSRR